MAFILNASKMTSHIANLHNCLAKCLSDFLSTPLLSCVFRNEADSGEVFSSQFFLNTKNRLLCCRFQFVVIVCRPNAIEDVVEVVDIVVTSWAASASLE